MSAPEFRVSDPVVLRSNPGMVAPVTGIAPEGEEVRYRLFRKGIIYVASRLGSGPAIAGYAQDVLRRVGPS